MSARATSKPVLFVTGHAPFDRVGAFARLSERENVEFALFGGRSQHGFDSAPAELPFAHRHVAQRELAALASSGRYRAVVCSTGGRVALPAAWAGARRARTPLILWASLWAHPRSAAHLLSFQALRRLYRSADAVVTYGPHVSAYVRSRGAHNVHVAPQSVDNDFWGAAASATPALTDWPTDAAVKFLFAGRATREKGSRVLIEAWRDSSLPAPSAALVLVGVGSAPPWIPAGGAVRPEPVFANPREPRDPREPSEVNTREPICMDPVGPRELRDVYRAADVLVVPSIATRTFREPWGLVVNEAMNQSLPVIASSAVGAAAGGLVRDGRNGLIVPAANTTALAGALRRLAADGPLRKRLGASAAADVRAYTHDAWAAGFTAALASLGLSREGRW